MQLLQNAQRVLVGQLTGDPLPDLLLINDLGWVQVLEYFCNGDVGLEPQTGFQAPSLVWRPRVAARGSQQ